MDTGAAPVIVTTYLAPSTAEDFAALEKAFQAVYARPGRMVFIAYLEGAKVPTADGRKRAAEMEAKLLPLSRRSSIAAIAVVRSPIIRGALTAIRWFQKAATDEHIVATMAEGVALAKALLAREGIPVSTAAERRLAELVAEKDRAR